MMSIGEIIEPADIHKAFIHSGVLSFDLSVQIVRAVPLQHDEQQRKQSVHVLKAKTMRSTSARVGLGTYSALRNSPSSCSGNIRVEEASVGKEKPKSSA